MHLDDYSIGHELVSTVLSWFKGIDIDSISCIGFEVLNQFFTANITCWQDVARIAITNGIRMACGFIQNENIKQAIITVCEQNKDKLIAMMKMLGQCCSVLAKKILYRLLESENDSVGNEIEGTNKAKGAVKIGVKLVIIAGTKYVLYTGTKAAVKQAAKSAAKQGMKTVTKQAAKTAAKHGAKQAAKAAAKHGAKQAAKAAAKHGAKQAAKAAAKHGAKQAAKAAAKHGAKQAAKTAAKHGAKQAAKTAAKHGAKQAAKTAAKHGAKQAAKGAAKQGAKQAAKQGAKHAAKHTAKHGAKTAAKQGAKSVAKAATTVASLAAPVGLIADVTQTGLETLGYENTGKAVGVTGNIVSGAMTGLAVAGPVGAVIGGAVGFTLWQTGEYVGQCTDKLIDSIAPDESKDKEDPKKSNQEGSTTPNGSQGENNTLGNNGGEEKEEQGREEKEEQGREEKEEQSEEDSGVWASFSSLSSWVGGYWRGERSDGSSSDNSGAKPDDTTRDTGKKNK